MEIIFQQGIVDNQLLLPKSFNLGQVKLSDGFSLPNREGKVWSENKMHPLITHQIPYLGRKQYLRTEAVEQMSLRLCLQKLSF